jgi:hypothetical protein
MNARAARTLRGVAAGTIATLIAAASHGLADGMLPGIAGLSLALAFSAIVGIVFAGRRLRLVQLTASVVLSQLAFHVLFSSMSAGGSVIASGHHVTALVSAPMEHASAPMWFAHAIAAVITIAAIRRGELALGAIVDTARMLLAALTPVTSPTPLRFNRGPRVAVPGSRVPRRTPDFLVALGHRGPPVAA